MHANELHVYSNAGTQAGIARKRHDQAQVSHFQRWLKFALSLEKEPYRTEAHQAFNDAYSAEATPTRIL